MEKIALIRPGAIGDIMMALNFVQELKSKKEVTFFCSSAIHSMLNNFISDNKLVSFQPLEQYKKENFDKTINLIGYPLNEGYPYKKMNRHLLEYFASEIETNFSFDQFTLTLPKFPKKIKNRNTPRYMTFQNKTGWSVYKEWWGWQELINLIKEKKPNIEIYQIGGSNDPKIHNNTYILETKHNYKGIMVEYDNNFEKL